MDQLLPDWAQPFGGAGRANAYWDLVCDVSGHRWGGDVSLSYLTGTVTHTDGRVARIHNIARDAVGRTDDVQRQGLYNFFSMMDDMERTRMFLQDWTWVRPRLRRRLQTRWQTEWELVSQPVDEHTQWLVVVDTDDSCVPVNAEQLGCWHVTRDEVWAVATAQALRPRGMRRLLVDEVTGVDGRATPLRFGNRLFCFAGDMYTSGIAADLTGRFQRALTSLGALVIAPTAHQLFVYPIRDVGQVPQLVAPLTVLSVIRTQTEPNPISNSVLWYREPGVLEPCTQFTPPSTIEIACTSDPLRSVLMEAERAA